jgi:phospholipase A-2-activating protein
MAFSEDGKKVISGAWDSQVFVWDVEKGAVTAELTGHQGPVWGIMVYDAKLVVTACADKMIRIFDISGKALHTIEGHTDVVRSFCKLPPDHWSGAAFASAGNDEVIRLWTLEGLQVAELDGHTAYIYDLAILPNGDIVSSSEDRTVRIWRNGQCIQTITHPAISIWAVAVCPETGDIASGASDKTIRVFSRDSDRQADVEVRCSQRMPYFQFQRNRLARRGDVVKLTCPCRPLHRSRRAIACTPFPQRLRAKVNRFRKKIYPGQVRMNRIIPCDPSLLPL